MTVAAAATGLVLTLVLLWGEVESDTAANAALTIALLAGALAQTAATTSRRRETDSGTLRALYLGAVVAGVALVAMASIAAWGDVNSTTYYRFLGALAVADLLLVLLQPAVRRLGAPAGRAALRLNAALNGVAIEVPEGDPLDVPPPEVDMVLVGDLCYDAALAARVTGWLDLCLARGIEVLVGDPRRTPLPLDRLELLHQAPVQETAAAVQTGAVFAFRRS